MTALYTVLDVLSRWQRVFAFALLASTAHADELWLTSGFISKHDKAGRNEENIGAGLELSFGNGWALAAGQYRNSMDANSRYAVVAWQPLTLASCLRVGAVAGMVSGYGVPASPLLLPVLSLDTRFLGFNLLAIPPVGRVRSASVALQVKLRLF